MRPSTSLCEKRLTAKRCGQLNLAAAFAGVFPAIAQNRTLKIGALISAASSDGRSIFSLKLNIPVIHALQTEGASLMYVDRDHQDGTKVGIRTLY